MSDPTDLETVIALESATNPRILLEAGNLSLIAPAERISGPGTTPIMGAFSNALPSRFSDGTFGVYHAAHKQTTAVAETRFHRERLLRDAGYGAEDLDMRVYSCTMTGMFHDLRKGPRTSSLYDPASYAASQAYGVKLHQKNNVDGIVHRAVRDWENHGEVLVAFRPRCVDHAIPIGYLQYRWDGERIYDVLQVAQLQA